MFAEIPGWTLLARVAFLITSMTVGASSERRGPPRLHGMRWRTARLAAKLALIDPDLGKELRQVTGHIVRLAESLERELHRLRPLEARLEQVIRQIEDSPTEEAVDDELFERLADRFGVLRVRPALQRLDQAHPDGADDEH